jgi:phosphotransferase family enzyme
VAVADQSFVDMMHPNRNRILWFGGRSSRSSNAEFADRDLILTERQLAGLADEDLVGVRGIVYSIDGLERTPVREHLQANLERIDDHGVAVILLVPNDHDSIHIQEAIEDAGLNRLSRVRIGGVSSSPDSDLAQIFVRHDPQLGWSGGLEIEKPDCEISATDELLLRRAFSDAVKIRLELLVGGKTAEVFRVHAQFWRNSVIVQPLPFFAKLGKLSKIDRELHNYRQYADFYVPFHLRPNIDQNRIVKGAKRGCFVGNFVEFAQPLWVAVEEGNFSAPLNSLFDMTLRGWWAQSFSDQQGPVTGRAVAGELGKEIFDNREVRGDHFERAKALGLTRLPIQIYEQLCDRHGAESFYRAPFHGDLHPGNIYVRNADAILIDLGSAREGPISGDPACLEVALAMDVRHSDLNTDQEEWTRDVDRLFAPDNFLTAQLPVEADAPWKHRVNAIRKVRILAQAARTCETGYQSAVAMYLLRRSMHPAGSFEDYPSTVRAKLSAVDADRRAYALVLADRLVCGNPRTNNAITGAQDSVSRDSREPSRSESAAGAARG